MNIGTTRHAARLGDLLPGAISPEFSGVEINSITCDSRTVEPGALFIAIRGEKFNGSDYIQRAFERGAAAVLSDSPVSKNDASAPTIYVKNLRQEVGHISSVFYSHPSKHMYVIGVTGTNGKSTCVSLIAQTYRLLKKPSATIGTLGVSTNDKDYTSTGGLTTADAIQCQKHLSDLRALNIESVAIEVSSHGIDQHRIAGIAFDIAVFTNLSRDHLDYHSSFEEYRAVKSKFIQSKMMKCSVVNSDDETGESNIRALKAKGANCISYSTKNIKADVSVRSAEYHGGGITANVITPWGSGIIRSSLLGEFNLSNILSVIAVCCVSGENLQGVLRALPRLSAVRGRMQRVVDDDERVEQSGVNVFIDYAHTPDALKKALDALRKHTLRKIIVVFGCGGDRDQGKRSLMGEIASSFADSIVVTSDNPRSENPDDIILQVMKGVKDKAKAKSLADRKKAIDQAVLMSDPGDCVLVAGKGHEEFQIIGNKKIPFNDYQVAREALIERCYHRLEAKV